MNGWFLLVPVLALPIAHQEGPEPKAQPRAPAGEPKKPAKAVKPKAEAPEIGRLTLKEALEIVRKEYRPLLIIYSAEDGAGGRFAQEMKESLEDPLTRKVLKGFVCVEVTREVLLAPYPAPDDPAGAPKPPAGGGEPKAAAGQAGPDPAGPDPAGPLKRVPPGAPRLPPGAPRVAPGALAGERLGIVTGVPALLVLDFRERAVRRYQEKFPRREALRQELREIAAEMARLAEAARKVEKVLERAEYSYALGETREAVLLILPFEDAKIRRSLDPVLSDRLASVIGRYRNDGATAMATGEALETEKRYLEAVEAFRQASLRFPFPEIQKASARRQADAMRKARGGL